MSSSTQSPLERAEAQTSHPNRMLKTEDDQVRIITQDHETQVEALQRSFKERVQSVILDAENAFKASAEARNDLEHKLQEERQRVNELTRKLDETKNNEMTAMLALEKRNHELTKVDLRQSKNQLAESLRRVVDLTGNLNATERDNSGLRQKCNRLSITVDVVKESNALVEAELDLRRSVSEDILQRLKTAEQRNVHLEADLKAATERFSGVEDELRTFKSFFNRINADMSSLAHSSAQQPILSQSMSSAPASNDQGSVEQRESRSETDVSLARPHHVDDQASNTTTNKDFDLYCCSSILDEVMDTTKNWDSNQYFLKAMDPLTLASRDAKVGPMNLEIMKEKLAKGAYTSFTSFKADFNVIVTDVRRMNPPGNPVRTAAERLLKIFDRAFSSQQTARSAQGINCKRKSASDALDISQDEPAQKRRSLAPTEQSSGPVQPAIPGARVSLTPASTASGQSGDATQDPEQTNADHVKGEITTGTRLEIDVTLSAVAQLVSKSPSTITGDWKSLVPNDWWITAHATPEKVEDHIGDVFDSSSSDLVTLRLLPAAGADKPEFDRLLEYLIQRERFATVSHFGVDSVRNIYLIPSSKNAIYPKFLSGLDRDLLPRPKAEDVLFMVIVFAVAEGKQRQFREAWDERMAAIKNNDNAGLVSMRGILREKPIAIFSEPKAVVTSAYRYLNNLDQLPYSTKSLKPDLQAHAEKILQLSYTKLKQGVRPSIAGIMAPVWVFVLGRVVGEKRRLGLLVVDMQSKGRPLWMIRHGFDTEDKQHRAIILLADKFPGCLKDWEALAPLGGKLNDGGIRIKDQGMKLMRCQLPV